MSYQRNFVWIGMKKSCILSLCVKHILPKTRKDVKMIRVPRGKNIKKLKKLYTNADRHHKRFWTEGNFDNIHILLNDF